MADALRELGYAFNEEGELRDEEGRNFEFTTQREYEKLGDAITDYLYEVMERKYHLRRLPVRPKRADLGMPDSRFGFVFASPGFDTCSTVLVLIHGSGAVRAGQWGRRLIINENLSEGSQLPYIEKALKRGWGVIVFNTNDNYCLVGGRAVDRKHSATPTQHATNAWWKYVHYSEAESIHVVAHSAGGGAFSQIMEKFRDDPVCSVTLTDSWYNGPLLRGIPVINFCAHPVGRPFAKASGSGKMIEMFAGSTDHDRTSAACINAAFYLMDNYDKYEDVRTRARLFAGIAIRVRGGCEAAKRFLTELDGPVAQVDECDEDEQGDEERESSCERAEEPAELNDQVIEALVENENGEPPNDRVFAASDVDPNGDVTEPDSISAPLSEKVVQNGTESDAESAPSSAKSPRVRSSSPDVVSDKKKRVECCDLA